MSFGENGNPIGADFDGRVRLFPLPNFVLFPGVAKGLHIFEPRYCAMLQEALATDGLIAMALLRPGWEKDYLQSPAIYEYVCIGLIQQHQPMPDGRHNISLSGLRRARILSDASSEFGFRHAQVELVSDKSDLELEVQAQCVQRLIAAAIRCQTHRKFVENMAAESLDLARFTDNLGYSLPISLAQKQSLLSEPSVQRRFEWLLRYLDPTFLDLGNAHENKSDDDDAQPRFSLN